MSKKWSKLKKIFPEGIPLPNGKISHDYKNFQKEKTEKLSLHLMHNNGTVTSTYIQEWYPDNTTKKIYTFQAYEENLDEKTHCINTNAAKMLHDAKQGVLITFSDQIKHYPKTDEDFDKL